MGAVLWGHCERGFGTSHDWVSKCEFADLGLRGRQSIASYLDLLGHRTLRALHSSHVEARSFLAGAVSLGSILLFLGSTLAQLSFTEGARVFNA